MTVKRAKPNSIRVEEVTRRISENLTIAIGRGDPAWDATEPASFTGAEDGLIDPIGYLRPFSIGYLTPDPDGSVDLGANGKFDISETPTRNGFVMARLDYSEAVGETIRELFIMRDAAFAGDVPDGQTYIELAKVTAAGEPVEMFRKNAVAKLEEQRTFILSFHP